MVIKGHVLDEKLVMEIGKFSILWNYFESSQCDNYCDANKIKAISASIHIGCEEQTEFAKVINKRRAAFRQVASDYVGNSLHPRNAHYSSEEARFLMQQFIEQDGDNLCCGCLLIIYRIRNNLLHGLKCIQNLNDQLELFQAVNAVLESLR